MAGGKTQGKKRHRINVWLGDVIHETVSRYAEARNTTDSEFLRYVLWTSS